MVRLSEEDCSGKVLDHLGLVADVIDELGLIEKIDKRLPIASGCGSKVSMGERVAAMILNGLGFIDCRLYMFPEFLEQKSVNRLFERVLDPAWFNDDTIGRCLDAIAAHGVTQLFTELSFEIGQEKGLLGRSVHFDTTTLQLYGQYEVDEEDEGIALPARGYSKSKRHDLKQMVLNLATTGKADFPIWMEPHSGNTSDKEILAASAERMQQLCNQLKQAPSFLYVGDSALYSNVLPHSHQLNWLTRVPETILPAKQLVRKKEADLVWHALENGYRYHVEKSDYKGVKQRWVLIFSEQGYAREVKTLMRHIDKEKEQLGKALKRASSEKFACMQDAEKAMKQVKKGIKYHAVHGHMKEIIGYPGRGKPKKGATKVVKGYQVSYQFAKDEEKIEQARLKKGRFILGTNELDTARLPDEQLLSEYKKQSGVESSFKFIKSNTFQVDSVFLKTPSRINALMMIMTLCLMTYGYTQHMLRSQLKKKNETLPNQKKKPTQKVNINYIYRLFSGIQELTICHEDIDQQLVINVSDLCKQILQHFGPRARAIYLNSS